MNKRKIIVTTRNNEAAIRFLSSIHLKGIKTFEVKEEANELSFLIYYHDLKKLRKLRKSSGTKIKLRYKSQSLIQPQGRIILGLLLLFLIPLIAQNFIWSVSVVAPTPEQRLKAEQLLTIQLPLRKDNLQLLNENANTMLQQVQNISWVHVKTVGSTTTISLQPAPIIIHSKEEQAATIVAAKNGTIDRFFVSSGVVAVKRGQYVKTGDVLVTNILDEGAQAKVFAYYWNTVKFQMPTNIVYYTENDKGEIEKQSIKLTDQEIYSHILPLVERKILAELPLETTLTLEKLLHLTYDNDTVKGEALYLVNENIAHSFMSSQGD